MSSVFPGEVDTLYLPALDGAVAPTDRGDDGTADMASLSGGSADSEGLILAGTGSDFFLSQLKIDGTGATLPILPH